MVKKVEENKVVKYKSYSNIIHIYQKEDSGKITYDIDLSKYNKKYTTYKIIKTDSFDAYNGEFKVQYPDAVESIGVFFSDRMEFIASGKSYKVKKSAFRGIIINHIEQLNPNPADLIYIALQLDDQFRGNYAVFFISVVMIVIGIALFNPKKVIRNIIVASGIIMLVCMLFISF